MSSSAALPADGELRIGGVRLAGHLVRAESGQQLAWVTDKPQQAPGRVWLELSRARAQTGLVPVLLADEPPLEWGDDQQDPSGAGCIRVEAAFTGLWDYQLPITTEERLDPVLAAERAPFGSQFPGLAPPEQVELDPLWLTWARDRLESVYDGPGAARIGLVSAVRAADVPAVLGWAHMDSAVLLTRGHDNMGQDNIPLVAVLRVLAERPPATIEAATALAAEHWAFCDGWLGESQLDTVQEIAAALMVTPVWSFWWD